ncbi:MAG: hypothetical protein GEV08_16850 [Acidimicrobiia bacterium]|nr:hypothetical protein [Acidimicrobiia bacterium]
MGRSDEGDEEYAQWWTKIRASWANSRMLTPRQAATLIGVLHEWADGPLDFWLEAPNEPLARVGPFKYMAPETFTPMGSLRSWVIEAQEHCRSVAAAMTRGEPPCERDNACYFDVMIIGVAFRAVELDGDPDKDLDPPHGGLPPRRLVDVQAGVHPDGEIWHDLIDEDWEEAEARFDDASDWRWWRRPLSPFEPAEVEWFLSTHHPRSWFEPGPPGPAAL